MLKPYEQHAIRRLLLINGGRASISPSSWVRCSNVVHTRHAESLLMAKRAVIFFGWVFFLISLGSPHVLGAHMGGASYVRRAKRNRIDRHRGQIERLTARTARAMLRVAASDGIGLLTDPCSSRELALFVPARMRTREKER